MEDEINGGGTPATQPSPTIPTPTTNPTSETPIAPQTPPQDGGFSLPDGYKDKEYLKGAKSLDDVYKMLDGAQTLLGKKTIGVPDWEKATPEEINEYYSKVRPEKPEDYGLEGLDKDEQKFYADLFHKHGLSKKQGQEVLKEHSAKMAEHFSEEGLKKEMTAVFGDNYGEKTSKVANLLKTTLKPEQLAMVEKLPNSTVAGVYGVVHQLLEKFGVNDTDIGKFADTSQVKTSTDMDAYFKEMKSLTTRNHTLEEKQAIMRKYGQIK